MKYEKVPLSTEQQIQILKERKLTIQNYERAKKYLKNIGYFRLSGYMYHLQKKDGSHEFNENINFNDIVVHYQFDKKLRALILNYLEIIEVALRSYLTDYFSTNHGFYWYTKHSLYENNNVFNLINTEITERFLEPQERFLKFFKNKYTSEILPPSNMAMEILTLGKLSRLYKSLSNNVEKKSIAIDFGLPSVILSSWLIYLNNVRNICAHHSRLWNRRITADRPIIPKRKSYKFNGEIPDDFNRTIYGVISMIDKLLLNINPSNHFTEKIVNLINQYPSVNPKFMGFPNDWKSSTVWVNG